MKIKPVLNICLPLLLALAGCATAPTSSTPSLPQGKLSFVDIDVFDRDLAQSLKAELPTVEVAFYEKVSPNAMPPRLQKWVQTAEGTGGRVQVDPPEGELVARNPLALLSLFGTLFSAARTVVQLQQENQLNAARDRDVVIKLERRPDGQVVVGKVLFNKRKPQ
jgi:hypothetical protein